MAYKKTYNPCDDCPYSFSKNNQESSTCKICEFKKLLNKYQNDTCTKEDTRELNLLDHYIKEVHSIKECEKYPDMIEVDVTCDCWGSVQRIKHLTNKTQWKLDLENGYFMS